MFMRIDFHTHIFSEDIARRATEKLSKGADLPVFTDGTATGLITSMEKAGVDISLILPVATKPSQVAALNRSAIECNRRFSLGGKAGTFPLMFFGALHPECEDYRDILKELSKNGIRGIKLHPVFQNTPMDDICYKRITYYARELGLMVLFHVGRDATYLDTTLSSHKYAAGLLSDVGTDGIILAHMGGWAEWAEVPEFLSKYPVLVDTAFSLGPTKNPFGDMTDDCFMDVVRILGPDRILFGTDSPWTDQKTSIEYINRLPLSNEDRQAILGDNARRLLL